MNRKINIGKKWRKVFTYTLWMFDYYLNKTNNELMIDDIDVMLLTGLKNSVLINLDKLKLNHDQMCFFLVLVDYINQKLLNEIEPPYTKNELEYFKLSQQFMERFNKSENLYETWRMSKLELSEIIKY